MKHKIPDEHLGSVREYLDEDKEAARLASEADFKARSAEMYSSLQRRHLFLNLWAMTDLPVGTYGDIVTEEDGSMYFVEKEVESATEKPDE